MLSEIFDNPIILMLMIFIGLLCICIIATIGIYFSNKSIRKKSHESSKRSSHTDEYHNNVSSLTNENKSVDSGKKASVNSNSINESNNIDELESEEDDDSLEDDMSDAAVKTKLSNKQIRRNQKKEERARKKEEERQRKAFLEAEKRRKAFNPKKSKPDNVSYISLTVSDGHLITCEIGKTPYYRAWEYEGALYYEFFCEPSRAAKAFNNHSAIIDPFCNKDTESVAFGQTTRMVIEEYGKMDANFNIIDKSLIKYE